ncbi:MAG: copper resistance protein CopC [Acidobacteriota bacterium]
MRRCGGAHARRATRVFWLGCLLVSWPIPAAAHSVLVKSSIEDHPIKARTATRVTMQFNSGVEVSLSRVQLVDSEGKQRTLEIVAAGKPGEITVQIPALAPGDYRLRYRMLATDGHVTDESLRFHVNALLRFSLADNPVPAWTPTRVSVRCDSPVKLESSRVFLVDSHQREGNALDLSAGDEPGEILVQLPALSSGKYKLHCKMLTTGGAWIEETLPFLVSAPR